MDTDYSQMFILDVQKYLRYQSMYLASPTTGGNIQAKSTKLDKVLFRLKGLADELKVPHRFLVRAYAYIYTEVFKCQTLGQVYLKMEEFSQKMRLIPLVDITEEDIDATFDIEGAWLAMNQFDTNTLPMNTRKFLSKKNLILGRNTFFEKTRNFISFCQVASSIRRNRLRFPQIHGFEEFFIHLPATRGEGKYRVEAYINAEKSLDKYYQDVYGKSDPKDRLAELLKTIPRTGDHLKVYKYSNLWAMPEIVRQIERDLFSNV